MPDVIECVGKPRRVTLDGDGAHRAFDTGVLPAHPGVVVFEAEGGQAVSVCATGDLRAFCSARLGANGDDTPRSATDLRPVTRSLAWWRVGGSFEADLIWLEAARERLPQTYTAALDRWRAWFLHLDPDAPNPVWRKVALHHIAQDGIDERTLIGPIADKDAARRFGEELDSVFDLCRYPKELALAPSGRACAYHEIGRCPAPCDGSEPMASYRARVREAVGLTVERAAFARTNGSLVEEMEAAVAAQDFERAAIVRDKLASLDKLSKGAFRNTGGLERLALVLVMPSEKRGWARVVLFAGWSLTWLADVCVEEVKDAARALEPVLVRASDSHFPLSVEAAERLGLICSYWFAPKKRGVCRRNAVLDLRHGFDARAFTLAVRAAAEPSEDAGGLDDMERWHDRELGG